jgi:signal transduction histidine kinase
VWVATEEYLAQVIHGQLVRLSTTGDFPRRIENITSLGTDELIVHDLERGLLRWQHGRFAKLSLPPAIQAQSVVTSFTDSAFRAWLAFRDGQLASVTAAGKVVMYDDRAPVSHGHYNAIVEDDEGTIWFAGSRGLTRYEHGRFANLHKDQGLFGTPLTSMVLDAASNMWIGSSLGITFVERDGLNRAFADAAYRPPMITYDRLDGLNGSPVAYSRNRRAIRRHSGKLWFLTGQGITIVDPATMVKPRPPVKVYVESLTADGKSFDLGGDVALPSKTRRVDLEFSALDVTFGSKTQFRYKLDAFDPSWIPAGTHRQVSYANLPPGHYRFLVSASEGDGRWVDSASSREFTIRPAVYQTAWFMAMLVLITAVMLWGGWRLHTRRVRREFSLLLRERARVSREIHDTLLQNLVALTLEFDDAAWSDEWRYSPAQLVRWRKLVEQYISAARQSIWNLRLPVTKERGFMDLLKENCERSAASQGADFVKFSITGQPRACSANAEEQVLRIAQEAVLNASRHACASAVNVEVAFDEEWLVLTIADDGTGFEPVWDEHRSADHYGLKMMRERAENIGGTFVITSTRGGGTVVSARLPASVSGS